MAFAAVTMAVGALALLSVREREALE
jgi:hypothetical protein